MNKKGQAGPIGAIFLYVLFIIMWFVFLGSWLAEVGQISITTNNLTGIEAFGYANLNLIVFIVLTLSLMGYLYFSGGQ